MTKKKKATNIDVEIIPEEDAKKVNITNQPKILRKEKGLFKKGTEGWKMCINAKKFPTPEDLEVAINGYFAECKKGLKHTYFDKRKSQEVTTTLSIPLTISGLANNIGISRRQLLNYRKKEGYEEYHQIVETAKHIIEQDVIERGLMNLSNPIFSIFLLKNSFGFKDVQETIVKRRVIDVEKNLLESNNDDV